MSFVEYIVLFFVWVYIPITLLSIVVHLMVSKTAKSRKWVKSVSVVVGAILYSSSVVLVWKYQSLWLEKFDAPIFFRILGIAFLLTAILIEFLSRKELGSRRIYGSSEFAREKDEGLVISGIYGYARHPRYVEHPLIFLGLGLLFGFVNMLWFSLYVFIGFWIVSLLEDYELRQRYGEEFDTYKKNVPAFFVNLIP